MHRGDDQQPGIFSFVLVKDRVPKDHPARKQRVLMDTILQQMDANISQVRHLVKLKARP